MLIKTGLLRAYLRVSHSFRLITGAPIVWVNSDNGNGTGLLKVSRKVQLRFAVICAVVGIFLMVDIVKTKMKLSEVTSSSYQMFPAVLLFTYGFLSSVHFSWTIGSNSKILEDFVNGMVQFENNYAREFQGTNFDCSIPQHLRES